MAKNGLKIAIYGKGGIGKSTTEQIWQRLLLYRGKKLCRLVVIPKPILRVI